MRLLEAIVEANHRAMSRAKVEPVPSEFTDAPPLVALTCIDPRLNHLFPDRLGIAEEKFIWLRNAGNIITGPLSSTMRSIALACAIKGGREIAIIGHTDCQVGKAGALQITDSFKALGIERKQLPENLTEYFGLFASERQNVLRGVDFIRQSPLIGTQVPVHGLLIDLDNGRLEWVVNGYQSFTMTHPAGAPVADVMAAPNESMAGMQTRIGDPTVPGPATLAARSTPGPMEIKTSESQIGDSASKIERIATTSMALPQEIRAAAAETARVAEATWQELVDLAKHYRVIGSDLKQYGPITGAKLLQWLAEGRVDAQTPAQFEGTGEWKPLLELVSRVLQKKKPLPPPLPPGVGQFLKDWKRGRKR